MSEKIECSLCGGFGTIPDPDAIYSINHIEGRPVVSSTSSDEINCPLCGGEGEIDVQSVQKAVRYQRGRGFALGLVFVGCWAVVLALLPSLQGLWHIIAPMLRLW